MSRMTGETGWSSVVSIPIISWAFARIASPCVIQPVGLLPERGRVRCATSIR